MPFEATVYRVLIASPGDVTPERDVVERAIHAWNDEHSRDRGVVFLPVRWERASPRGGPSGQEVVNEDLVETSDVLIGMFWTKIGRKTKNDLSGSVEEIRKFALSGKPYGLFFKIAPVPYDHIPRQFAAVNKLKREVYSFDSDVSGLAQDFKEPNELDRPVGKFLTDTLRRLRGGAGDGGEATPGGSVIPSRLNPNIEAILRAAAVAAIEGEDSRAVLITKDLDSAVAKLSDVAYQSAVEDLTRRGLVTIQSNHGGAGRLVNISREGLERGLRLLGHDLVSIEARIRADVCRESPTTVEEIASRLDIPSLVVRHIVDGFSLQRLLSVERFSGSTRVGKPTSELCDWDRQRPRKACLVLTHLGPIQRDSLDYVSIGVELRNEGDYPARDVKLTKDLGEGFEPEPESAAIDEILPGKATGSGFGFRVRGPIKDDTNSWVPGQKQDVRLRVTFRDGLDERDEAIFTIRMHNESGLWTPVEDRGAAKLAPICQFARPESR